jgi:hypothetical protein
MDNAFKYLGRFPNQCSCDKLALRKDFDCAGLTKGTA